LVNENDIKVKRLAGKIDRVLSTRRAAAFGTLRRNPDLKWRQTAAGIAELAAKQGRILTAAAALVKSGGRLVYATCSFVRAENQDVVTAFLAAHPQFQVLPANEALGATAHRARYGRITCNCIRSITAATVFFAAVLVRKT